MDDHPHKQNELKHLRSTFDFENLKVLAFGAHRLEVEHALLNMRQFGGTKVDLKVDGPDLIAEYGEDKIGIEHFVYDSSSRNRKGSVEKHQYEKSAKDFERRAKRAAYAGEDLFEIQKMDIQINSDTLKNNFLGGFEQHLKKIDYYRQNIKSDKVWFLAEDTSIMTPMVHGGFLDNFPEYPLLPIHFDDVTNRIIKSSVDGVIFMSTFPRSNYVVMVKNNKKAFLDFKNYYNFKENTPVEYFGNHNIGFSSSCVFEVEK